MLASADIQSTLDELSNSNFYLQAIESSLSDTPLPVNAEQQVQEYAARFENLKENYLEQETREKFMRAFLDIPPQFPSDDMLQEKVYESLGSKKASLNKMAQEMQELEQKLADSTQKVQSESLKGDFKEEANELKDLSLQKEQLLVKLQELEHKKTVQEMQKQALKQDLDQLSQEFKESQQSLLEAQKKAKEADPGVDELTKWYKESNELLSKLLGVVSIRLLKGMVLQILFKAPSTQSIVTLLVKMRKTNSGEWKISEAETDNSIDLNDLVKYANSNFNTLEEQLGWFIFEARQKQNVL